MHTPEIAVSTVIFALSSELKHNNSQKLFLPLVRRIREPYKNLWALPGGALTLNESLLDCAKRHLGETTALRPKYLEQLYTFGDTNRSGNNLKTSTVNSLSKNVFTEPHEQVYADRRVISIIYWALVQAEGNVDSDLPENVSWFNVDSANNIDALSIAFDHKNIIKYALWRLRNKIEYDTIAANFLGETFTLKQLREVHEVILDRKLDPANFRRQITLNNNIFPTEKHSRGAHRPARLYTHKNLTEQNNVLN